MNRFTLDSCGVQRCCHWGSSPGCRLRDLFFLCCNLTLRCHAVVSRHPALLPWRLCLLSEISTARLGRFLVHSWAISWLSCRSGSLSGPSCGVVPFCSSLQAVSMSWRHHAVLWRCIAISETFSELMSRRLLLHHGHVPHWTSSLGDCCVDTRTKDDLNVLSCDLGASQEAVQKQVSCKAFGCCNVFNTTCLLAHPNSAWRAVLMGISNVAPGISACSIFHDGIFGSS